VGILIRGNLSPKPIPGYENYLTLSHNTLHKNKKGILIGPDYANQGPLVIPGDMNILISTNLVLQNNLSGIEVSSLNASPTARIIVKNNDSFNNNNNAPQSQYVYPTNLPNSVLVQTDNLSLQPYRDEYFRLKPESPLFGKGANGTDISSYSSSRSDLPIAPDLNPIFSVETITNIFQKEYDAVKKQLEDVFADRIPKLSVTNTSKTTSLPSPDDDSH